jgi:hypothetical protein
MESDESVESPSAQDLEGWRPGKDLTQLETRIVSSASSGDRIDFGTGPFDLPEMRAWPPDREIRAAVLRHLLVEDEWPIAGKGVRLRGIRISGNLDFEAAAIRCPLRLDACYLDASDPVNLDESTVRILTLTGCRLPGLTGERLTVGDLDLRGSILTGPLILNSAQITGSFDCGGAQLSYFDADHYAMSADRLKVDSGMFLDDGFIAAGAIRLTGATISGPFSCRGAQLSGTDRGSYSLIADRLTADSGMFLDEGFTAAGAIRLTSATISGPLSCSGARMSGRDAGGYALVADQIKADSGVFLDDGFTAAGAIRLTGATISGPLSCRGAYLAGSTGDGYALFADKIAVSGNVLFDEGFAVAGMVALPSANVSGSVYIEPAGTEEMAFSLARAQIEGVLSWLPKMQALREVNLEGTTVAELDDQWDDDRPNGYWPTGGKLRLDGLSYERISGPQQATVAQRLGWIRSQLQPSDRGASARFAVQPYDQLVAVYRQAGQDSEARQVDVAMRRDMRRYGNLTLYRRAINWAADKTVQYGYQNWRAGLAMVAIYLEIMILSILAQHHGLIVPIGDTTGLPRMPTATQCSADYPCFDPAGYAVDVVFPLINVHQAEFWGINAAAPWGQAAAAILLVSTVLGWVGATFLVSGLTSLVRRQ